MTAAPPTHLRVEHLDEPLGIDARPPRLSWRLPDGSTQQLAYEVRAVDSGVPIGADSAPIGHSRVLWDSGRVASDRSVLVPYGGPPLVSGQRVEWSVKVWTDLGESEWAAPAWWEMGLLDPADWVAAWIEPPEADDPGATGERPAWLLRHPFTVTGPAERARLYATAHGLYEAFLNEQRIGDFELSPGSTSYEANLHVQTYDVTDLVRDGDNVVGAVLSDGWYRGQNGAYRRANAFGDHLAFLAQLHIVRPDGSIERVTTNGEWTASVRSIVAADLMQGQVVDFRRDRSTWCAPAASASSAASAAPEPASATNHWAPVRVVAHDLGRLCASPAPPVRRVEEITPVTVRKVGDHQVVDLGQNINGWVRLADLGPAGTTVTLTHGEALGRTGDVTMQHLTMPLGDLGPIQVDTVTSAGKPGEVFEPRHTTHGFQYVSVAGHPGEFTIDDVTGVVVHTALRRTGWFECSDERVNRLHDAVVWSFRGNACDVPTDCPQRERSGWAGDWQIFVPTAAFLYDVAGFSTKWLRDLSADQLPNGAVPHVVPAPQRSGGEPYLAEAPPGACGWADAAVIVPWEIYRAYGDERLLAEQWPSMTAWVDYAAGVARSARHPDRVKARSTPAPHEQFLWDSGFHFGEWLEPDTPEQSPRYWEGDKGDVATAYLHYSSRLLAETARVLGHLDDAARYEELAANSRAAWQAEYLASDGSLTPAKQANYVRALAFGLVPDELRPATAEGLVGLVRQADTHLGTGFLATPYLLPVLADTGHLDVAYELLFQDTPPSWLTMLDRGATTIWEHWEGVAADGKPNASLNHYSKGAVVSFLHTRTAGIRLADGDPGYRHFRVEPLPGGGLTAAAARHDSPYGRIESSWRIVGDQFHLDVTVPPGTTADIRLPDGYAATATPGTHSFTATLRQ